MTLLAELHDQRLDYQFGALDRDLVTAGEHVRALDLVDEAAGEVEEQHVLLGLVAQHDGAVVARVARPRRGRDQPASRHGAGPQGGGRYELSQGSNGSGMTFAAAAGTSAASAWTKGA